MDGYVNNQVAEPISDEMFVVCGPESGDAEKIGRPHVGYLQDVWRRLRENKIALLALVVLIVLNALVVIGPSLSGYSFEEIDKTARNKPPSAQHWFGTDKLGRDLFARVWHGGRVSMLIGLTAAFVSSFIGCIYGGAAAYFGGRVDDLMMRVVEIIQSIPYLIVVILFSIIMQSKSLFTILLALTLTGWCGIARLVRGQMLQIRGQEYVLAAQALGVAPWKIIRRHMIPNMFSVVIVAITFDIPGYIFSEAFLSYIGLGIQPPETSWGALASAAQLEYMFYPHLLFFPALMIALTMLSFTLLGDALRDALDPRLRR